MSATRRGPRRVSAPQTPEEMLAVAERMLAELGAEGQVTVSRERSLTSRFARSRPTQATEIDQRVVEVLALVDGHTGLVTGTDLGGAGLGELARRARAIAAAGAARGPGAFPGLPTPSPPTEERAAPTAAPGPAGAASALAEAFAVAAQRGLEAFGTWTAGSVQTAIASSAGVRAYDVVNDAFMKVICRHRGGRTGFASGAAPSATELDPGGLCAQAAAKVKPEPPTQLEAGTYPVVMEPYAVASLLEFLGALAFNGLAHAEGRGALAGRLGSRVAAAAINLADSPRYPGTLARAFDAEGVPKAPLPLIQDGIAQRVVHDTRSAARAGTGAATTGHALAPGGHADGPIPTNLVLHGGGASDERELAADVRRGIYVTRLWYLNAVDEREVLLTGTSRDGTFLIEDGEVTRPLRDVRFTDSALRLLGATQALTAQPRLVCEGEFYGRRFATGVVCPGLRAEGFRVTGSTPAR
ncbi:MAG: hypothetical protein E6G56_04285 [Actinobacteria bacterium]|nr:MAG: hypothetical protein E6G56_04285 [Actinomycetota bacterium]